MSIPLTRNLGEFVARLRYSDIPKEALDVIHTGFADTVGVMIAGAGQSAPQILKAVLASSGAEATVLFGEGRASAPEAAWINGTAAHAFDFDDFALRAHPSTVLVPAILAEAEALAASGEQMVLAYAAGYEAWAELLRRDADKIKYHTKGWHGTGIFGTIAAAAACASLRKLDARQAAMAIAIAASQAAGLAVSFGTMTKPSHAGRAAHAGMISARLAEKGFTGSDEAFEHHEGFLRAFSPAGRIDLESPLEAGTSWKLLSERPSIKKYPMCFAVHCALDGVLDLLAKNDVRADDVKQITVTFNRRHMIVLRYHAPQSALEGKFSMEFAMACAVIAKRVGLPEVTDAFVRRPDVQALMRRVMLIEDDEDPARPGFAMNDRVTLETTRGQLDSGRLSGVRGGPEAPLSREELWTKFEACLEAGTARLPAKAVFDALMSLDRLPNVRVLPGLLS